MLTNVVETYDSLHLIPLIPFHNRPTHTSIAPEMSTTRQLSDSSLPAPTSARIRSRFPAERLPLLDTFLRADGKRGSRCFCVAAGLCQPRANVSPPLWSRYACEANPTAFLRDSVSLAHTVNCNRAIVSGRNEHLVQVGVPDEGKFEDAWLELFVVDRALP